jgi:2-oxoglutarate dehydrogenase E1 component
MSEQINIESVTYVESLYSKYLAEPASIADEWRDYFEQANGNGQQVRGQSPRVALPARSDSLTRKNGDRPVEVEPSIVTLPTQLNEMIQAYRSYGHLNARVDPLNRRKPSDMSLDPEAFGFVDSHMDKLLASEAIRFGTPLTLCEFVQRLEQMYCGPIGFEFTHIADRAARTWLQERIERVGERSNLDCEDQLRILSRLNHAQAFEQFIRKKFLGAKSFSLEGAESLIPLIEFAIEKAADQGVLEIVLAMAHRGRLNVLANILGKRPGDIFREFIDPSVAHIDGSGDVKYHLGHSHDYVTRSGHKVHLSLCFNPSHLEFVNPVALGRVRAKQDRSEDSERSRTMAFLIHGDAAFAGEGIAQETLNLSRLKAYDVGGAIHVVLNNQIGFTTPPGAARSTVYATDVAKMLQLPIFHVNGDEPESVIYVMRLAMEFRAAFGQDVVIDMYCYRRLGHNEGDEPSFTQPRLYQAIAKQKNIRQLYCQRLLSQQRVTMAQVAEMESNYTRRLEQEFSAARDERQAPVREDLQGIWAEYYGGPEENAQEITSAIAPERAARLLELQTQLPEGFHPHPKMTRAMEARRKMAAGKIPLDWSAAESLALASLAADGVRIRLSGQDSARGTCPSSASPATGSATRHKEQQEHLLDKALTFA